MKQIEEIILNKTIPVEENSEFKRGLKRLNKKLKKLNLPQTEIISKEYKLTVHEDSRGRREICEFHYKIKTQTQINPDYELLGVVDKVGKDIWVQRSFKQDVGDLTPNHKLTCSHCNKKRLRKRYFVFKKNDELVYIGSDCQDHYISFDPSFFNFWDTDSPNIEVAGSGSDFTFPLNRFLNIVRKIVKEDGEYISVAKSVKMYQLMNEDATFDELNALGDKFSTKKKVDDFINGSSFEELSKFSNSDKEINKIISDVLNDLSDATSDYEVNLKNGLSTEYVVAKSRGIVASVFAYLDNKKRNEELERIKAEKESKKDALKHIGTVGEKEVFDVKLVDRRWIDNSFGGSYLWTLTTKDNQIIKSFSNSSIFDFFYNNKKEIIKDKFIKFSAIIKKHGEYDGFKETLIKVTSRKPILTN
jgi:hypothetical protein